jgi:hypothetical protein
VCNPSALLGGFQCPSENDLSPLARRFYPFPRFAVDNQPGMINEIHKNEFTILNSKAVNPNQRHLKTLDIHICNSGFLSRTIFAFTKTNLATFPSEKDVLKGH